MRKCISPPLPYVAIPVLNMIEPEDPLLEVPVVKDNDPLTPLVPAFAVRNTTAPLDVTYPSPVVRDIAPPVLVSWVVIPADTTTSLPVYVFPTPARR
jgi:hypothetical protein